MFKLKIGKSKTLLFYLIGFVFIFGFLFITGEILIRLKGLEKPPPYNVADLDEKYGWKMKPNYFWEGEMETDAGITYPVRLTSTKNGFKEFGNVNSDKKKVFFIGDSYTQSVEISNEKSFYRILQDSLEIESFVYGQAGWGTLQEFWLIEEYLEKIKPDLIILQTCSNDFIDNHHTLEFVCGYNIGLRRPYLNLDGNIEYLKSDRFENSWINNSELLKFLIRKLENASFTLEEFGEYYIMEEGLDFLPFKESVEITFNLFEKLKESINGNYPIVVFSADNLALQTEQFQIICDSLNIPFVESPAKELALLKWNGASVHTLDGYHWNEFGHEIVAKTLMPILEDFLKK